MNEQLLNRIRQCPNLPTLPAIAVQVLELAQDLDVDIAQIARVIAKDSALSSKILRTVNSSFYGRSQAVSTISHALVILGLQSVKTLVLGFSLVSNLTANKAKGFKHFNYWRRSIHAATAARTIAARIGVIQQEEAFLAALLMDIGTLVLDQALGDEYGAVCETVKSHADLAAAETAAFGGNHAEVGGVFAAEWKLPPLLSVPIASHHSPQDVEDSALQELTNLISLAGDCADVFANEDSGPFINRVRKRCLDEHNMAQADCDTMLEEIGTRTREVASLFEINLGPSVTFETILKRANETLVELTLQTQHQVSTFQAQATTLVVQNQQLKHQATTDALTDLANRARFDAFLAEHFAAASKQGKPLALLMLDVDKFKSINDRHGHPAGDKVLAALGKLLGSAARPQDLAARYGGEELALVLTGTARSTAAVIAETVRRAIAAKPITVGSTSIPVTASIGVAIFEPGSRFQDTGHLIKAADLALYAAKRAGRNCVRVFSLSKPTTDPAEKPAAA